MKPKMMGSPSDRRLFRFCRMTVCHYHSIESGQENRHPDKKHHRETREATPRNNPQTDFVDPETLPRCPRKGMFDFLNRFAAFSAVFRFLLDVL